MTPSALDAPQVQAVLEREHGRAAGDDTIMAEVRPKIEAAKKAGEPTSALYPDTVYLAVAPDMGRFLYLAARTIAAQTIVEFGSSFGISTIYFAAAAKETGGRVIGSEYEANKIAHARANLEEAGLAAHAEIRAGDALETLADLAEPIDLLFLDGWKDLYIPVLDLLEGKLRPGALVLADNIHTFPDDLAAYMDRVTRPGGPYLSTVLPFESGLAYSVFVGT